MMKQSDPVLEAVREGLAAAPPAAAGRGRGSISDVYRWMWRQRAALADCPSLSAGRPAPRDAGVVQRMKFGFQGLGPQLVIHPFTNGGLPLSHHLQHFHAQPFVIGIQLLDQRLGFT
jgi:hypothetical protein